jgi:hypothetical protein
MKISLPPECYECLLKHVPKEYSVHAIVRAAKKRTGRTKPLEYVVDCDRDHAQVLLLIGERHCQQYAPVIIRVIQGTFRKGADES